MSEFFKLLTHRKAVKRVRRLHSLSLSHMYPPRAMFTTLHSRLLMAVLPIAWNVLTAARHPLFYYHEQTCAMAAKKHYQNKLYVNNIDSGNPVLMPKITFYFILLSGLFSSKIYVVLICFMLESAIFFPLSNRSV